MTTDDWNRIRALEEWKAFNPHDLIGSPREQTDADDAAVREGAARFWNLPPELTTWPEEVLRRTREMFEKFDSGLEDQMRAHALVLDGAGQLLWVDVASVMSPAEKHHAAQAVREQIERVKGVAVAFITEGWQVYVKDGEQRPTGDFSHDPRASEQLMVQIERIDDFAKSWTTRAQITRDGAKRMLGEWSPLARLETSGRFTHFFTRKRIGAVPIDVTWLPPAYAKLFDDASALAECPECGAARGTSCGKAFHAGRLAAAAEANPELIQRFQELRPTGRS